MTDDQSQLPDGDDHRDSPAEPDAPAAGAMSCAVCATVYGADMRFCPLDGSILRPVTDGRSDLIGVVIDSRYYLTKKLGHGGMGDVYLGEHVRTQRLCAVKVVSRVQSRDPEALGRFLREATNAGRISHPHVATVYDFGETDNGLFYLAMEYVDGEPLSRLLEREGALPPARAVEIARQVAEGVSAAHELGIVHRDLKPGNILIARDRKNADLVKVVDFGIARAPADEQQNLTRTGIIIGTPEYMSPEQLIGDPVDGRSDIYSLGCILYQMLTGEQAFGGPTAQVITRRLTERPPRPREKNPAVPKSLDDLIVTTLGRTPQERFQSMEAVRDALLNAPAQAPATGPHRLVAWLGLQSNDADAEEPAAPPPVTGATRAMGPAAPAGHDDIAAALDHDRDSTPDHPDSIMFPAQPSDAAPYSTGEYEPIVDGEAAESPARRLPIGRLALAAASVVVLLGMIVRFTGDSGAADDGVAALPEDTAALVLTVPMPPAPDSIALAGIWAEMSVAEEQDFADEFVAAMERLQAAESRLEPILAEFPDDSIVRVLADSLQGQINATSLRCITSRTVALNRNETAPECAVIE
jgi:eukaryotic-like serine/threonine-protein kinase